MIAKTLPNGNIMYGCEFPTICISPDQLQEMRESLDPVEAMLAMFIYAALERERLIEMEAKK